MHKIISLVQKVPIKTTFLYFGGTILSFLISIVTYPLFAKYLTVSEFAAFNYFTNYSGFFTFFFSFNLYMYFSSHYFRVEDQGRETLMKSLMSLLLIWNIFSVLLVGICSYIFLQYILHIKFNVNHYLIFSLIAVSVGSLKTIYLVKLRLEKKPLLFFIISSISKICSIGVGLFLVIHFEASAQSRFIGIICAELSVAIFIYWTIFRNGGFTIRKIPFKKIFGFVWPLLLSSIVYYPLIGLDQMFLEQKVDTRTLGLYSIGLNFATYLHTFNFAMYQTIEPDIIKAKVHNDLKKLKNYIFRLAALGGTTTLLFCLVSKYLIFFMSKGRFTEAYPLSNVLAVSYFFVLIFTLGDAMLIAAGKGKKVLLVNASGCLCTILFLSIAVRHGAMAVAAARVLSFMAIAAISLIMAFQKDKSIGNESIVVH
jgi:O-antigen/teichoic acid export membrane protein